jgi:galactokinase
LCDAFWTYYIKIINNVIVSTPGKICLFGEHQDYLGLPVIAVGISRSVSITGERRQDKKINISNCRISFSSKGLL